MVPMCVYDGNKFQTPDIPFSALPPPPTVVPLDPDRVSIMGLHLPFQVAPGEGGIGV